MIRKGFTLVELLVVMGVLAVLASGLIIAINPLDKINAANDTKVQNDISQVSAALSAYAAANNGYFPTVAAGLNALVTNGDLTVVPLPPAGYISPYGYSPSGCVAAGCIVAVVTGQLKSSKYATGGYTTWRYDSATARACAWNGACKP